MRNETSQGQEDNEEENLKEEVILGKASKPGFYFFLDNARDFCYRFSLNINC